MSGTTRGAQVIHDLLLDAVADHPADCALCKAAAETSDLNKEHAGMSDTTTLTKAEHDAAVAAAVTKAVADATQPLAAELAELKAASQAEATDKRVEDLQAQLDTAVAEKAAADLNLVAVNEYLAATKAEEDRAAAVAARKDARAAEITQIGLLPAEHIANAAARWAELDDDAWTDKVAEYKAIATAHNVAPPTEPGEVPGKAAVVPTPSPFTATAGAERPDEFAFDDVFGLRGQGIDLSTHVN